MFKVDLQLHPELKKGLGTVQVVLEPLLNDGKKGAKTTHFNGAEHAHPIHTHTYITTILY